MHPAVLVALGMVLHFLFRWGEHWRSVGPTSAIAYVKLDPVGWTFAVVATVAIYLTLSSIGPLLGIDLTNGAGQLLAGYTASSLGAKLPGITSGKSGVR